MAQIRNSSLDLYERDYYAWLQEQVRALRERRSEDVDWDKVEEIEDLGKRERCGVRCHLATIIEHLLKLSYARGIFREYNARGWRINVRSARTQLQRFLNESPNLRPVLQMLLVEAYEHGRLEALRDRRLKEGTLPKAPPWTLEQVMDENFLPD
jgi:Domain of unknown function DUF29